MRSTSFDETPLRRFGLPRWALFAAIPPVLALGFISGIALSTYWPAPLPPAAAEGATQPAEQPAGATAEPRRSAGGPAAPQSGAGGLHESPDVRRTGSAAPTLPQAIDDPPPYISRLPGPMPGQGTPGKGGSAPQVEVRTRAEAREALVREFGAFEVNGEKLFAVDYQVARDYKLDIVLIGIVKISDYPAWLRATREYPAQLESWLKGAAMRIKPAAETEKFSLVWTIFETVSEPPAGFSGREVTARPGGQGFVVTRPLAAVTDMAKSAVSIASTDVNASQPATSTVPWASYGPVIRFDTNDLYRPTPGKP